jgi:hypothetical protein
VTAPELHVVDRSGWASGPWDTEPDRIEWREHGLACLVTRSPLGHLCGYVAVPRGHPWHGVDFGSGRSPEEGVSKPEVHGGPTYGAACQGHVCHVPEPGEPDDVWWVGFDCAHYGDVSPRMAVMFSDRHGTYRTIAYVRSETSTLAAQASGLT